MQVQNLSAHSTPVVISFWQAHVSSPCPNLSSILTAKEEKMHKTKLPFIVALSVIY